MLEMLRFGDAAMSLVSDDPMESNDPTNPKSTPNGSRHGLST